MMKTMRTMPALMLVAMLAWPCAAEPYVAPEVDPQAVVLRPLPIPGKTTRYRLWTMRDQTVTMAAGPNRRSMSNRMEVEGECTWVIGAVRPDGGFTATMTMDWMTARLTMPDASVQNNDSRRPRGDTEAVHTLLRAMSGVPLTFDVAADGTVASVRGTEAMKRKAGDVPVPEDLDFIESASDLAMISAAPATLASGRSWDTRFRWSHEAGWLHHDMRYTLGGVEEIEGIPVANVAGVARTRLEVDRSKIPRDGPPIDIRQRSGGVQTQIMFDLVRREAVGRNSSETRVIETNIRLPQATLSRTIDEVINSQVLRIEER
jgi:hypothetical protein